MRYIFLFLILPLTSQAMGDEETPLLEEIVVTADLRDNTRLRDIPTSVTALDRETLAAAGNQHFQEVMHLVPNLNWSSATNRPRFLQIRGIGERSQYEGAPNPSVGFLVDDIDFSGIGGVATLMDIEQIEVLRGPQGTRYGANALAGLVYVRTADPTPVPDYHLTTQVADDGAWAAGFSASGPIRDDLAYRLSINQYRSDGFRFNDFLARDDTNRRDELALKGKFKWLATPNLTVDTTVLAVDVDNGFDAFAPENTFTTHTDKPGKDAQQSIGLAIKTNYTGWQAADLVTITTAAKSDILYSFDGDWGNSDYWGAFAPYDFTAATDRARDTLSQEIRWVSSPGSEIFNGSTAWIFGIYAAHLNEDNGFDDFFNGEVFRQLDSDYSATSTALFGQLDTELSARTRLSGGLRVERRDADYRDSSGLDLNPSDHMLGGQLSLVQEFSGNANGYLRLARGFKAGGFNLGIDLTPQRRQYDPEYLWNLEVGIKGQFLDGRLHANVALFHSERDDIQIETSFQADPSDPLTFLFFTDNAASGTNYGLEAEWRYRVSNSWALFGTVGLLQTQFDDFVTPERDFSGREQAHAPEYQASLGAEYRSSLGWFARADLFASDRFFFSNSHDQRSEPYQLYNLKLGYERERWAVYAWGRNLGDERYATRGFFFGLEPPNFPNRRYTQLGDPRHYGITARIGFQ